MIRIAITFVLFCTSIVVPPTALFFGPLFFFAVRRFYRQIQAMKQEDLDLAVAKAHAAEVRYWAGRA